MWKLPEKFPVTAEEKTEIGEGNKQITSMMCVCVMGPVITIDHCRKIGILEIIMHPCGTNFVYSDGNTNYNVILVETRK